jgi:ribonuclease HI
MKYTAYCDGGVYNHHQPDKSKRLPYYSVKILNEEGTPVYNEKYPLSNSDASTNNVCEYVAMESALGTLRYIMKEGDSATVYTDSLLVVKQLSGEYKVRNVFLQKFYDNVKLVLKELKGVEIRWVSRDEIVKHLGH